MALPRCLSLVAILCFSVVCNIGSADPLEDARQLIRAKRFNDAVQALEMLHDASLGTGESHYLLGSLYWQQKHEGQTITKALVEFETAVELKHAKAMHRLGLLYLVGVELPQDIALARDLLSQSTQLGYHLADAQLLKAQSDFFDMEEWDPCALIDYRRDAELLSTEDWSESIKKRTFFCAVAASNLSALAIWQEKGWGLNWQNRWGQNGLHVAITAKSHAVLEWLLQQGVAVDVADDRGNTPLHVAVALQDQISIDLLLDHQADWSWRNQANATPLELTSSDALRNYAVDRGANSLAEQTKQRRKRAYFEHGKAAQYGVFAGWPAINVAAWLGKEETVAQLLPRADLAATDPEGYTPLVRAACAGHKSVYQIMQTAGADRFVTPEQTIDLVQCLAANQWREEFSRAARELVTGLMTADEFNALLNLVAEAGFEEDLSKVVKQEGENRRIDVATLKRVVRLNNPDFTRQVFDYALPVIQQRVLFDALKYGWSLPLSLLQLSVENQWIDAELDTPLIASSSAGNVEAIGALIPFSEVDAQNKAGNTALHSAVLADHAPAVQALLQAGCDVEIRNEESLTPLMLAVHHAGEDVINLLIKAGANPDRRDKFGVSVREHARALGRNGL